MGETRPTKPVLAAVQAAPVFGRLERRSPRRSPSSVLARIDEEHLALDTAGHYNRPDVFSLTVDERPRVQASWAREEDT